MENNEQEKLFREFMDQWEKNDYIEVHTSGSTGTPKLIRLPKKQVIRSAMRTNSFFGITKKSRLHAPISFQYIGGKMMIVRSIVSGCSLTFEKPALTSELTAEDIVDFISVTPPQLPYILDHQEKFSNVKTILIGGAAINKNLEKRLIESGLNCWESYAMTETATHIALRKIGRDRNFIPMKGVSISTNADGALIIKDGEYEIHTNDIAEIFGDGTFRILGRKDDMIITGAKKVHPLDLEAILANFISHEEFEYFITSSPDELWGQAITLVVSSKIPPQESQATFLYEIQSNSGTTDTMNKNETNDRIRECIRNIISEIPQDIMPSWKRPKEIIVVDSLPRTSNGKILRKLP